MYDAQLQARFARSYTNAAMGYATAANQAYFEAAGQVIDFWSKALAPSPPAPAADQRSWYRAPDRYDRSGSAKGFAAAFGVPTDTARAWQSMMVAPWTLSPAAWPSAFAMVSNGVPESVAFPAAEANVAAADAAMAVSVAVEQVFSSYRSEGGHASAQIVRLPMPDVFAAVAAVPLGLALYDWSWQLLSRPPFAA